MAIQQVAGTCYFSVDGEELNLSGSLSITFSDFTREAKMGSGRMIGFSQTNVAPQIRGEFFVDHGFPLNTILESTGMTIVAELANGWRYTLSDAFFTGDGAEFSPEDGTVTLTFIGKKCDWDI
nr:MAG TPA: Tail tube [Caudoviricetes sp.]